MEMFIEAAMFRRGMTMLTSSAVTLMFRAQATRLAWAVSRRGTCCRSSSSSSLGLLASEEMRMPGSEGFNLLTERVLNQSRNLVDKIRSAPPGAETVRMFDVLSDGLCQVADLAECFRNLHPDPRVVEAAHASITSLSEYIEVLNTDEGMYRSLEAVLSSPAHCRTLDPVTQRVAQSFMHDFRINGIHLDRRRRETVVRLHGDILEAGHSFATGSPSELLLPRSTLPQGLAPYLTPAPSPPNGRPDLCLLNPSTAAALMLSIRSEAVRRFAYEALNAVEPSQLELLDRLVDCRHRLASTVGQPSYCHLATQDTMVGSPGRLMEFLEALTAANRAGVESEVETLRRLKAKESGHRGATSAARVEAWDVDYLVRKANAGSSGTAEHGIKEYLPFEACFEGLDRLYSKLYGIRLVVEEEGGAAGASLWHSSVKTIRVEHEREGCLGYILGDFFERRTDKNHSNCHFTLRGGRLLENGSYQLPVIVVCCDLPPQAPHLLSLAHAGSFFHEMGHALHSVLGRTRYQQVTGTRCSLDFAEVPSSLNELFLRDERVLGSLGLHHRTGARLPERVARSALQRESSFPAIELQKQILDTAFDAVLHLNRGGGDATSSTSALRVWEEVEAEFGLVSHVPGTAWFLRFSHLHVYGSRYFSYLWARAIANLVWKECFEGDPFSRAAGEAYRRKVLAHGGEFPPSQLIADLLGYQPSVGDLVKSLVGATQS